MLTPKKKITKKEIKQDTLLTTYAKATEYYYANKKNISYAVTALAIVIIGLFVYVNNRRANNEKAAVEVAKVSTIYDRALNGDTRLFRTAIDGQPEQGIMGLKLIVDNYGGTESGQVARFYLANAYFNLGQFDDAMKAFDDFSSGNKLLKASGLAGVASCYEAKKEYAKAAPYFERAAAVKADPAVTPEYLSNAARCYGMGGEKEKAVSLLKQLKKEYPASPAARDADRYLSEFSA